MGLYPSPTGPSIRRPPSIHERIHQLEQALRQLRSRKQHDGSPKLHSILVKAAASPQRTRDRILSLVPLRSKNVTARHESLLRIAELCLTGAVGRVGARGALRAVAILLLDFILEQNPDHMKARLTKGEALLPVHHYGKSDPFTPRSVLQEAYSDFLRVASMQKADPLALFLQGRWLLSNESQHKDTALASTGRDYVLAAAEKGCARAYTYLAHRYENLYLDIGVKFSGDLPRGKREREMYIFNLYLRAAALKDADALNDIATSYVEGFAGLPMDFDIAVYFYELAIRHGSLLAYDNLGTHYETGMDGKFPDRIDYKKALRYYRKGAKERCPKCAHNMASAYEEGMGNIIQPDVRRAEKYYIYALRLCDDANDTLTAGRCLRDLASLYLTQIKLNAPDSTEGNRALHHLNFFMGDQPLVNRSMEKLNRAISTANKGRGKIQPLKNMVGDKNARLILDRLKDVEGRVREDNNITDLIMFHHIMGVDDGSAEPDGGKRKRSRRSTAPAMRKRRRSGE